MMKKWLIRFSGLIVAFFIILTVLPFAFKGKILKAAQDAASESVNAKITFDEDLSLSLIRNFPNLSVGVNNLKIVGIDSFAKDTLFQAENIKLTLDIASVFSETEPIGIKKIYLNNPNIYVHVLKSGRANYDIVPYDSTAPVEAVDTASAPISLKLNHIEVVNAHIRYKDVSMGVDFESIASNFDAEGDFQKDIFTLVSHYTAESLNLSNEGMTLVSKATLDIQSDIQMDLEKFRFGFEPLTAKLNELPLEMKGWVQMNDENMDMDLNFGVPNSEFKSLLSAIPGCFTSDFSQVKASGKMAFDMAIKGVMDEVQMPQTKINLVIDNAQFQYPELPKSVSGINMDLHVLNEDGNPDHTTVDLKNFSLILGNDPFKMALFTKNPISNPYARGNLSVNMDLKDWQDFLPLDSGMNLSGKIKAGLVFDGHYASIENQTFNDLKLEGSLGLYGFQYAAPGLLKTDIKNLEIIASPNASLIKPSHIRYGTSNIEISEGKLNNMLGYALNGEALTGTLRINSPRIDVNELMPATSEETKEGSTTDSSQLTAPQIPTNLNLFFEGTIGKLLYDDYQLNNCKASIHIKDGKLNIDPIRAELWESSISFTTQYAYFEGGKPHVDFSFALQNLIPKNIGSNLKIVETYAPIVKDLDAPFNLNMNMLTDLDEELNLDMKSLVSEGLMSVTNAQQLKSPEWLSQAFEQLKWNKSKIKDVKIKPGKLGFSIKDGKLSLKDSIRLDVYEGSKMSFSGNVDLDQNLDFNGYFYTQGKAVPMSIKGTTTQPKLRIDWKKLGMQVVDEYKEKAITEIKDEANKVADKAIEEAEVQAAKLISEAKDKANQLRKEGQSLAEKTRSESDKLAQSVIDKSKQEIDALIAKARNPLEKLAAEKAGKKANEQAVKKAESLRSEGYAKAQAIENETNAKADSLENETKARAEKIIEEARNKQNSKLK